VESRRLETRVRVLELYAIAATSVLLLFASTAFARQEQRTKFGVIDVERINVVEKDGTLRLSIANRARMPDPVIGGKAYPLRGGNGAGSAGLIFFNDQGNESGGLAYAGADTGRGYFASGMLTFDQFNQNEALALSYSDANGHRRAGLSVLDQPEVSIQSAAESLMVIRAMPNGAQKDERMRRLREGQTQSGANVARVFVGKRADRAAMLMLADPKGRPRLRLLVDSLGTARLELLDEAGRVTHRLPETGR
jgi:hypothetical protein